MTSGGVPQRSDISAIAVWLACIAIYAIITTLTFINPALLSGPPTEQGRYSELGLIELSQNIVLFIALVLMMWLALRARDGLLRAWAIFIAIGTFLLLGEEISWGQHFFGWTTTGVFENVNDQGETNFHNIGDGWLDQKPRALLLLGMILGTIVHPLVKYFRGGRGLFDRPWWLAPTLASLAPVIMSQVAALPKTLDSLNKDLHFLTSSAQDFMGGVRASEVEEIFLYIFFVTYTASILKRLPR